MSTIPRTPASVALFVYFVVFLFSPANAVGQGTAPRDDSALDPAIIRVGFGRDEVLLDSSNTRIVIEERSSMTVDEVARLPADRWETPPEPMRFGYTDRPVWLRVTVRRMTVDPSIFITETRGIDRFDVWYVDSATSRPRYVGKSGWRPDGGGGVVVTPQAISAVMIDQWSIRPTTLIIRAESDSALDPRLSIASHTRFHAVNGVRLLIQGSGFGFTLVLVVFAAVTAIMTRRREFLSYLLLVVVSVGLVAHVSGFGALTLWRRYPLVGDLMSRLHIMVFVIASIDFFRTFFAEVPQAARINRTFGILEIVVAVYAVVVLFFSRQSALEMNSIIATPLYLGNYALLFIAIVRRVRNAVMFFIAWSVLVVVGFIAAASNVGLFGGAGIDVDTTIWVPAGLLVMHAILVATILRRVELQRNDERRRRNEAERVASRVQEQVIRSERMNGLATLVGSVSHELGTPLGIGVTLGSDLSTRTQQILTAYRDGTMTKSALEEYIASSQEAGDVLVANMERARELIDGFKLIAADQAVVSAREVVVAEYLTSVVRSIRPRFKRTPHTVEVTAHGNPVVFTVPGFLSQVIVNLINNALAHAFSAEKPGRIDVIASEVSSSEAPSSDATGSGGNRVEIVVRDTGRGIPPDALPNIFETYYTTAGNDGGTGLGLSIVRSLVEERLNGSITVESEVGVGTTFTIVLGDIPKRGDEMLQIE